MTQILSDFILALRAADVRVSTAESIDAAATLDVIGFEQRDVVKEALSQVLVVLAKYPVHRDSLQVKLPSPQD